MRLAGSEQTAGRRQPPSRHQPVVPGYTHAPLSSSLILLEEKQIDSVIFLNRVKENLISAIVLYIYFLRSYSVAPRVRVDGRRAVTQKFDPREK